jgi:hypothetical protein
MRTLLAALALLNLALWLWLALGEIPDQVREPGRAAQQVQAGRVTVLDEAQLQQRRAQAAAAAAQDASKP